MRVLARFWPYMFGEELAQNIGSFLHEEDELTNWDAFEFELLLAFLQ